jgi:hypothetical protein
MRKTALAQPYKDGGTIVVKDMSGFEIGDFVYLAETQKPYSHTNYGGPAWPVDDVFYQGWGNIQSINSKTNSITMHPYRHIIPSLPEGTVVIRSDHANAKSFEFMDAEYTQWPMQGEGVANAGPFYMQHGCWRVEVEPVEHRTADAFLHVMLACDKDTFAESKAVLQQKIALVENGNSIDLRIEGKTRTYKVVFQKGSSDAHVTVTEAGKTVLDNELTYTAIKARSREKR